MIAALPQPEQRRESRTRITYHDLQDRALVSVSQDSHISFFYPGC
jgi:hypothetical protein